MTEKLCSATNEVNNNAEIVVSLMSPFEYVDRETGEKKSFSALQDKVVGSPMIAATRGSNDVVSSPMLAATRGSSDIVSSPMLAATRGSSDVVSHPMLAATRGSSDVVTSPMLAATRGSIDVASTPMAAATRGNIDLAESVGTCAGSVQGAKIQDFRMLLKSFSNDLITIK